MTDARTLALIDDLRRLPAESPRVEFKENNVDPQMIGRLVSALANAARAVDQPCAWLLWGVLLLGAGLVAAFAFSLLRGRPSA